MLQQIYMQKIVFLKTFLNFAPLVILFGGVSQYVCENINSSKDTVKLLSNASNYNAQYLNRFVYSGSC